MSRSSSTTICWLRYARVFLFIFSSFTGGSGAQARMMARKTAGLDANSSSALTSSLMTTNGKFLQYSVRYICRIVSAWNHVSPKGGVDRRGATGRGFDGRLRMSVAPGLFSVDTAGRDFVAPETVSELIWDERRCAMSFSRECSVLVSSSSLCSSDSTRLNRSATSFTKIISCNGV